MTEESFLSDWCNRSCYAVELDWLESNYCRSCGDCCCSFFETAEKRYLLLNTDCPLYTEIVMDIFNGNTDKLLSRMNILSK